MTQRIRQRIRLCRLTEIPDGTARGFVIEDGSERGLDLFVFRNGERAIAWRNECPHQGTPLETFPDRFLTRDGRAYLCTTHGAQFRLTDGYCFKGPCEGKKLRALRLHRDGEELLVELAD